MDKKDNKRIYNSDILSKRSSSKFLHGNNSRINENSKFVPVFQSMALTQIKEIGKSGEPISSDFDVEDSKEYVDDLRL